ncbi:MAG: cyclic pyranopterin monophosphate synthase MoaC [Verrucomicrobia bacterium]|nr:cyclic pyranopterin monophosphate synthase MoaC [Verrucomicrobiota bacterium]MCH8528710.1 cyclic pyranopterin monophosphate synthase MoaC [Kiritimatiellia bacterium]
MTDFTHLDSQNMPAMVDISGKAVTARNATARVRVVFPPDVAEKLATDGWQAPKGPILHTAVIAGTQAVKRTWDLIPFCHPLPIDGCKFSHNLTDNVLELRCTVRTTHRTGVEMEALTGVSIAALTVIDMCKALSHEIEIRDTVLLEKTGGKRDVRVS